MLYCGMIGIKSEGKSMNQASPKAVRISLPAAEKMARELKAGHFYRIELSAFT